MEYKIDFSDEEVRAKLSSCKTTKQKVYTVLKMMYEHGDNICESHHRRSIGDIFLMANSYFHIEKSKLFKTMQELCYDEKVESIYCTGIGKRSYIITTHSRYSNSMDEYGLYFNEYSNKKHVEEMTKRFPIETYE